METSFRWARQARQREQCPPRRGSSGGGKGAHLRKGRKKRGRRGAGRGRARYYFLVRSAGITRRNKAAAPWRGFTHPPAPGHKQLCRGLRIAVAAHTPADVQQTTACIFLSQVK